VSRTRLVFVRHAEPDKQVRNRVYGRLDIGLSPAGTAHAEELAAQLAGEPIVRVYSSPLRRALETAAPLARALELEPVVVDDLRELDFGELEGLTVDDAVARYPVEAGWMTSPGGASFPAGESVAALRERVLAAVAAIAEGHAAETVAVFSHSLPIRVVLADALTMPVDALFRLELAYGGVSVVEWFEGRPFVGVVNAARL